MASHWLRDDVVDIKRSHFSKEKEIAETAANWDYHKASCMHCLNGLGGVITFLCSNPYGKQIPKLALRKTSKKQEHILQGKQITTLPYLLPFWLNPSNPELTDITLALGKSKPQSARVKQFKVWRIECKSSSWA